MQKPSLTIFRRLQVLGYGGLIPFVGLAVAVQLLEPFALQSLARVALTLYAVTILSFVGAVSWGIALSDDRLDDAARARLLTFSVVPSLMAWLSWFLPGDSMRLVALALLVALVYLVDRRHGLQFEWPVEWLNLRRNLSLIVVICLLLAAAKGI